MYKLLGTVIVHPRGSGGFPNNFQTPPFFTRDREPSQYDEIDDSSDSKFGLDTHQQVNLDSAPKPQTHSNKKKTPPKQTSSKIEHTEYQYSIDAPQSYIVGAAISPAIIPITYYPIHPANVGASTTKNDNAKKSSSNNRPKPLKKPTTNESHRNVVPYNTVPLIWYPANYPVHSGSNVQRDLSLAHSKLQSTTKLPVIRQPLKQSNQIQTFNLAAYYGYLNHLNSKQKYPN